MPKDPRKPFYFKQFKIYHDRCAMKVGTDAVLLGAWARVDAAKTVLDIGSGSGVISLMLAQRGQDIQQIDAIEIEPVAAAQCEENFNNSPWSDLFHTHCVDVKEFVNSNPYDLIVSNPPFFKSGSAATEQKRAAARHTGSLPHETLLNAVNNLLQPSGLFCVVLPFHEANDFIGLAEKENIFLIEKLEVRPKKDKPIERCLIAFKKQKPASVGIGELVIQFEKRNDFTPEYIALTKEYHTIL